MSSILFLIPLPPPVHGSSMMAETIRNSRIINDGMKNLYVNLSTSRAMDEIGHKPFLKILRTLSILLQVLWMLLTKRIDKCYLFMQCYGIGFLKDAAIAFLCKAFGKHLMIHHHTFGIASYKNKPLYRILYKTVYKNSDVILLSDLMRNDFGDLLDNSIVHIVPNGIASHNDGTYSFEKRGSDTPRLLFVSNLLPSKGIYDLLDACAILKASGCKFQCQLIGAETKEINAPIFNKEVEKRDLSDCVEYLGKKYGKEKWQHFADADIFIHPSHDDCMPLVILEAMDFALPVVATNIGCIPDEVTDGTTGHLVLPHDVKALTLALKRLITDKSLRLAMGKAGKSRFDENFTASNFIDKIHTTILNGSKQQ